MKSDGGLAELRKIEWSVKCPYGRSYGHLVAQMSIWWLNVHIAAQMSQYVAQMDSRSSAPGFMVAQIDIRVAQKVT
jgi:hypothetical protein